MSDSILYLCNENIINRPNRVLTVTEPELPAPVTLRRGQQVAVGLLSAGGGCDENIINRSNHVMTVPQ